MRKCILLIQNPDTKRPTQREQRIERGSLQVSPRRTSGHLDDLPSCSQLVLDLVLDPRDDGSVVTLFHPVLGPDDDLTRLGVLETEDFLRRERHDEHRYFVFEHLSSGNLRKGVD